jgi:hypothetical protein
VNNVGFSAVWDMVVAASDNSDVPPPYYVTNYAQVGYWRLGSAYGADAGDHTFLQYTDYCSAHRNVPPGCAGDPGFVTELGPAPLTSSKYSVIYNGFEICMLVDGVTIDCTNGFDPITSWSQLWGVQFSGEVHNVGDDIAGWSTSQTWFANVLRYQQSDDTYHTPTHWISLAPSFTRSTLNPAAPPLISGGTKFSIYSGS